MEGPSPLAQAFTETAGLLATTALVASATILAGSAAWAGSLAVGLDLGALGLSAAAAWRRPEPTLVAFGTVMLTVLIFGAAWGAFAAFMAWKMSIAPVWPAFSLAAGVAGILAALELIRHPERHR